MSPPPFRFSLRPASIYKEAHRAYLSKEEHLDNKPTPSGYSALEVKVWGDYACFTRPEQKLERVSYSTMTPSAARGILESIFWHKPMQWRVLEIVTLKRGKFFSILRNEVSSTMSHRSRGLSITEERSQRHTLGLRQVAYLIRADVWLPPGTYDEAGRPVDPAKYRDQFRRRVRIGACHHQPYLGCREFAAYFSEPDGTEVPDFNATDEDENLGQMLFDIRYRDAKQGGNTPIFFPATLQKGVLRIDSDRYEGATQ